MDSRGQRRPKHTALSLITRHGNLWAIERLFAEAAMVELEQIDLHVHLSEVREERDLQERDLQEARAFSEDANSAPYGLFDGTAIIPISGVMTKKGSSWGESASMEEVRSLLRHASRSSDVRDILMVLDSPGGSISGLADLAADVRAAKSQKPVVAYVEDLCCSAAYWTASQADAIYANAPTADVGSLGVRMVVRDYSEMFDKKGVRTIPVDTGEFKSAGEPGTKITDAQIAEWQRLVDQTGDEFVNAVANGRGMTEDAVRALFTGQVWNATDAQRLGLIDGIAPLDAVLSDMRSAREGADDRRHTTRLAASATTGGKEGEQMAEGTSFWDQLKAKLSGEAATVEEPQSQAAAVTVTSGNPAIVIDASGDIAARLTALEADNKSLRDEVTALKAERDEAQKNAEAAQASAVDNWLLRMKKEGYLLPTGDADAREDYETYGEAKATERLHRRGKVGPFRSGELGSDVRVRTVVAESGSDEIGDRLAEITRRIVAASSNGTANGREDK